MKFGKVNNPEQIDFSFPEDHPDTERILSRYRNQEKPEIYIGCAKWNRTELKNFYPRGTKDELTYYSTQFNAIELNATFYRNFSEDQVKTWYDKVPHDFRFFPKVNQNVSHLKWLNDIRSQTDDFLSSIVHFDEKLGTVFLQMRDNFSPKFFDRVVDFVETWPEEVSLAIELRHRDWFCDPKIAEDLYQLLEEHDVANVIVDTAGRRDMMHMRLTNNEAFIRFVGANHSSDTARLDDWVERLKVWVDQGLRHIHFFVHQNVEKESPKLADYFIKSLSQAVL